VLKSSILELRGGAGPLDTVMTAKVAMVVGLADGLVCNLAPSAANQFYGLPSNPTNDYLMKQFGAGLLTFVIFGYCLITKKTSLATAHLFALIPWLLESLRGVLAGDVTKAGLDKNGSIFSLFALCLVMFGCTQDWAETAMKVASVFWFLNGAYLTIKPKLASKLWGDKELDRAGILLARLVGSSITAGNLMVAAMAFKDVDATKAFGYGWLIFCCNYVVDWLVKGDAKKLGFPMESQIFWLVLESVVGFTLAL
jgi:hypothetical protein